MSSLASDFFYCIKVLKSCKTAEQVDIANKMYRNYEKLHRTRKYGDLWFAEYQNILWEVN